MSVFISSSRACCAVLRCSSFWIYAVFFFYVLLLNRFTVKEAKQSVSNVTAGGKKPAPTDRETPFWRIKSVKWLWESRERSWTCAAGWRALRTPPHFLLPRLNLFSFSLLYWWSSDPSLSLCHFSKSIFSLKCSALSQFSAFFIPLPLFFLFWSNHFRLFFLDPLWLSSHFSQSLFRRQTDWVIMFALDPTASMQRSHYFSLLAEF